MAVLSAGLVLGIGASVTMAAWTDNEYASGSFAASVFNLQSKDAVGSTWTDHPSTTPIVFAASSGMSPSASVFVGMDVRTTAASTVGGTAGLVADMASAPGTTPVAGSPLPDALEYRAVRLTGTAIATTCSAAFVSGAVYLAGNVTTWVPVVPITQPSTATATLAAGAGDMHRYCFDVRIKPLSSNNYQGATGTITWHVNGISS